MSHSPLPWTAFRSTDHGDFTFITCEPERMERGNAAWLAVMAEDECPNEDAALIVSCVNAVGRLKDPSTAIAMAEDVARRCIAELDGIEHGQIRDHCTALLAALGKV